jgi:hypothetical protein
MASNRSIGSFPRAKSIGDDSQSLFSAAWNRFPVALRPGYNRGMNGWPKMTVRTAALATIAVVVVVIAIVVFPIGQPVVGWDLWFSIGTLAPALAHMWYETLRDRSGEVPPSPVEIKQQRRVSFIVAINFTFLCGYVAFGMPPARGRLKQAIVAAALGLLVWSWLAFTWWRTSSIKHPDSTDGSH